jgi:DNA-binding beta-propeller fold protein YncE
VLSDVAHHTIRLLTPGTGAIAPLAGMTDTPGFADATGTNARFDRPYGVALAADGSLLVADQNNHRIRRVTLAGVVSTFAGDGTAARDDGPVATASFNGPQDVAVDGGRVYVADTLNYLVRRVEGGNVTTIAGTGTRGFAPGEGLTAQFAGLEGFDLTDDSRTLWIADGSGGADDGFNRVRRVRVR